MELGSDRRPCANVSVWEPKKDPRGKYAGNWRQHDWRTSIDAGLSIYEYSVNQRTKLGCVFYEYGRLTDYEAFPLAGLSRVGTPWKRCTELRQAGLLVPTGDKRPTETGCDANVWEMPDYARRWWKENVL